jgi:hypothetical protein
MDYVPGEIGFSQVFQVVERGERREKRERDLPDFNEYSCQRSKPKPVRDMENKRILYLSLSQHQTLHLVLIRAFKIHVFPELEPQRNT